MTLYLFLIRRVAQLVVVATLLLLLPISTRTWSLANASDGTAVRLSSCELPTAEANGLAHDPAVSGDGSVVAFTAMCSASAEGWQLYVLQRNLGRLSRVTAISPEADVGPYDAEVSADGRFISYIIGDGHNEYTGSHVNDQAYLLDVASGESRRISESSAGVAGNGDTLDADVSGNGSLVVVESAATNLASGGDPYMEDVFLWESATAGFRALTSPLPQFRSDSPSGGRKPVLSSDGSTVAYEARGTDDLGMAAYVVIQDVASDTRVVLTEAPEADPGYWKNRPKSVHAISSDGDTVLFSGEHGVIWKYSSGAPRPEPLGYSSTGALMTGSASMSGDATTIAVSSTDSLTAQDSDGGYNDLYLVRAGGPPELLPSTVDAPPSTFFASPQVVGDGSGVVFTSSLDHETDVTVDPSAIYVEEFRSTNYPPPPLIGGGTSGMAYVALGDSFSSGEGLSPFEPATDTAENRCHRSVAYAYSRAVAEFVGATLSNKACSGAIVNDFYIARQGHYGQDAQLNYVDAETDLITLSIGGNDAGFSWVVDQCVRGRGNCYENPKVTNWVRAALAGLRRGRGEYCVPGEDHCFSGSSPLDALYTDIAQRSPSAQIVVVNYPNLFVRNPTEKCDLGSKLYWLPGVNRLTVGEIDWLNTKTVKLNQAITSEIVEAQEHGVRVTLANAYKHFGDHGLCSERSWIIALQVEEGTLDPSPFSLHPTRRGQRALAESVNQRLVQVGDF